MPKAVKYIIGGLVALVLYIVFGFLPSLAYNPGGIKGIVSTGIASGYPLLVAPSSSNGSVVVALYSTSLPVSSSGWFYYEGDEPSAWAYTSITIDGTQRQYIEWQYDDSQFDDQSGNNNNTIPTFRTSSIDSDVSASLNSFQPIDTARAPAYSVSDPLPFLTGNITMVGNFTSSTIPSGGPPGTELVEDVAEAGGTPSIWLWGILGGFSIAMAGLGISYMERRYGSGGGALILRIGIASAIFGLFITFGKFDWWMLILYLFIVIALAMASRHAEWGGNINQLSLIGFLAMSWVGLTAINRILEGQFITAGETSFMNNLMFTQPLRLGVFEIPVINFGFFTEGIPRLLQFDYSFFGGQAQLLQYMLYSFTAIMSFIIFALTIVLLSNFLSRLGR